MIKKLKAANNPFLDDHIIGGNKVFPTVCAIAWMADAAESIYQGFKYRGLENYKLFKGIVFDGAQAEDYFIDLKLIDESAEQLRVDIKISSLNTKEKPVFHYAAEVILSSKRINKKASQLVLSDSLAKNEIVKSKDDAKKLYQNGTLFHGDSLRGIEQVIECDNNGLLLACCIKHNAKKKQGEFPLGTNNIFANDLVYQAMLVWVRKQLGMGSLPSSTKNWKVYSEVNSEQSFYLKLTVVEQKPDKLIADISLINVNKVIMAEIESAEVTVSDSLNDLFKSSK